jgi:glycosyltransferase involved in cell wall biosynthesis
MAEFSKDLTFVVFTFNEEKRIERVIKNFMKFGSILIVDNESTDSTLDIAKEYNCEVLVNKNMGWVEDEVTTSRVKKVVKTEWIYWAFADEMIDFSTVEAIYSAINTGKYDVINISRKNYYYGHFCFDAFADRMNRIFKKEAIDFTGNKIHGFGTVTVEKEKILYLPDSHFVHHFISNTAESYLNVINRYTSIDADSDKKFRGVSRMMLGAAKIFLVNIIIRGGYKSMPSAFFLVLNMIYYSWVANMKAYEKMNNLGRSEIEEKNNRYRDSILNTLR